MPIRIVIVIKTYILAYKDSNPQLLSLCVKSLTSIIAYMMYDHNNYIISYYKIFRVFNLLDQKRPRDRAAEQEVKRSSRPNIGKIAL